MSKTKQQKRDVELVVKEKMRLGRTVSFREVRALMRRLGSYRTRLHKRANTVNELTDALAAERQKQVRSLALKNKQLVEENQSLVSEVQSLFTEVARLRSELDLANAAVMNNSATKTNGVPMPNGVPMATRAFPASLEETLVGNARLG